MFIIITIKTFMKIINPVFVKRGSDDKIIQIRGEEITIDCNRPKVVQVLEYCWNELPFEFKLQYIE